MPHLLVSASRFLSGVLLVCGLGAAQAQDLYLNGTVGGNIAPGVYGQISFGTQPPPPVLYAQPVRIERGPMDGPPLYLYVPPGHSKNWRKYCGRYNACGRPVYFVQVNERNRWWAQPHGGPRAPKNRPDGGDGHPGAHGGGKGQHGKHDRDQSKHDRDHGQRPFDHRN